VPTDARTLDAGAPSAQPSAQPGAPIDFWQAVAFWFKLGFISFGGPAGQIAIMHRVLVDERRWISERRFLHALNYCMVLPGPEAQQLATYIGWLMHRTVGGIIAGSLFVLPSLGIMIGLSWVYMTWGSTPLVAGLFLGIKPAVTAIVIQAAHRIGSRTLRNAPLWLIAAASFVAIALLGVPFPAVVIMAALIGHGLGRVAPHTVSIAGGHAPKSGAATAAAHAGVKAGDTTDAVARPIIDDDTPRPAHARFRGSRLAWVVGIAGLLWLVPMAALIALRGWDETLTQMGWFFTKAAFLTFGGAYAVLPYVYQGAVEEFHWLTAAQMIDGLALGETTPGPLIMIVSFVGYVGGHASALLGTDARFLAGALAACVATWFTFLPSFLFILAGGPLVESSRGEARVTAPLTAITAAVVGVIGSLALFFAGHVLWPDGLAGRFDVAAALITAGAAMALLRWKTNVMLVIGVCALAGLGVQTLA
jgi:chromate transporter